MMGRPEARASLIRLVKDEPSSETIDALVATGDDECFVALGRLADMWPDLRHLIVQALAGSEHRLAVTIVRLLILIWPRSLASAIKVIRLQLLPIVSADVIEPRSQRFG